MSQKKENKAASAAKGAKNASAKRDKNGRFAKGGAKPSEKKPAIKDSASKKGPEITRCGSTTYIFFAKQPSFDDAFRGMCEKKDEAKTEEGIANGFLKDVGENNPERIRINGKAYYSEPAVAKMLNTAIGTCAEVAAAEFAKLESASDEEVVKDTSEAPQKPSLVKRLSQKEIPLKMAKFAARVIMWSFLAGFLSVTAFGLYSIIVKLLAR